MLKEKYSCKILQPRGTVTSRVTRLRNAISVLTAGNELLEESDPLVVSTRVRDTRLYKSIIGTMYESNEYIFFVHYYLFRNFIVAFVLLIDLSKYGACNKRESTAIFGNAK